MREVILRPRAERDIANIANYTIEQWGKMQARQYVATLRSAIQGLGDSALRHPTAEALHPGLRRMPCQRHIIYFLASDRTVEIIRILHERMDVTGRLGT
jgi:toxin ParE1/3/4